MSRPEESYSFAVPRGNPATSAGNTNPESRWTHGEIGEEPGVNEGGNSDAARKQVEMAKRKTVSALENREPSDREIERRRFTRGKL